MTRVFVWNEFYSEQHSDTVRQVYPEGIHTCLAKMLGEDENLEVLTGTLYDEDQGLPLDLLETVDVLIWWGHSQHDKVSDELADAVRQRVLDGMGLIVLHSGHLSKPFVRLMGTSCNLQWRDDDRERMWTVLPQHPIAKGVPASFEIEREEMYGERFDIPTPDELIFIGWFAGGEVFRSGCTWYRGAGRVFYFQPGHEEYPNYRHPEIQKIIRNAVAWATPTYHNTREGSPNAVPSAEAKREAAPQA